MSRKFLFCFPLRAGNYVFGFILIIISIAVAAYHLYMLGMSLDRSYENESKFRNWQHLELVGEDKNSVIWIIRVVYFTSYVAVAMLLFFFSVVFTVGVAKANHCLVSTFFVYSFFHLFFTVGLLVLEATSDGYIQIGLLMLTDVLLIICLFGVNHMMEAIRTGHVYSRPGKVYR